MHEPQKAHTRHIGTNHIQALKGKYSPYDRHPTCSSSDARIKKEEKEQSCKNAMTKAGKGMDALIVKEICRRQQEMQIKEKAPDVRVRGFLVKLPDDNLLSHWLQHYHRREIVSRSCSGWEGVVPTRYGHQA